MATDGGCESDVVHGINEGNTAYAALTSIMSNRGLGKNAKKCILL